MIAAPLKALVFDEQRAGGIGIFDVLEHIQDQDDFLRSVHHALTDQGMLYITVPAFPWLWTNFDDWAGHFCRYTKKSLQDVLHQNNFTVIYSSFLFSSMVVPMILGRCLPYWLGFGRKTTPEGRTKTMHAVVHPGVRWLKLFLKNEMSALRKSSILCGTSIIAVARKRS